VESVSVRLETVLTRLSAQFRSMPESRLLGRLRDGRSRAAAGHELAGLLALTAQGVEDREGHAPPTWRALPFEGPFVVGDQIGVTGRDLLVACAVAMGVTVTGAVGAGAGAAGNIAGVGGESGAEGCEVWAPVTGDGAPRGERVGIGELLRRVLGEAEGLAGVL
jgi:hypothetical protein